MSQISVCMIAKNEAHNLEKSLSAVSSYPFEIVVVDTGSTDNTKEIASKYTNNIYDFVWCNDFSAARNFAIQKASNDWVLVLDCDETITYLDYDALLSFCRVHPDSIGRIEIDSLDHGGLTTITYMERFFDRRIYHYEDIIHEQVRRIDGMQDSSHPIPLTVEHSGYSTADIARRKADRNLSLLFEALKTNPHNPYILFHIGQSYFMVKDYDNALTYFDQALNYDLPMQAEYVQLLIVSYGYTLIHTNHAKEAIEILKPLETYFSNLADFPFLQGCCHMNCQEYLKAIQYFVKALAVPHCNAQGVNSYLALYNLGFLYATLGEKSMAIDFLNRCAKQYAPARDLLKELSN